MATRLRTAALTLLEMARTAGMVASESTNIDIMASAEAILQLEACLAGRPDQPSDVITSGTMAEAIQYHRRSGIVIDGEWYDANGWSTNFSRRARGVHTMRRFLHDDTADIPKSDPWLNAIRRMMQEVAA